MANIAAEKVFLAGVCHYPEKLFEFVQYLDESDFQHAATKMTFEALRSMIVDKEVTVITKAKIVAEAKSIGHQNYLSATKNGEWIDELFLEAMAPHELAIHFMEVKRQSLKDKYAESFTELKDYLSTTDDPLSAIISKVENTIVSKVNILDKGEHAIVDMREGFKEFLETLANDPGHIGLDLGYPIWQERAGHVRNGSITFIVGTTGSGKSQFGLNAALKAARKGLPVLYLDSELNKSDQWIRMAAILAKVDSQYIETGFWQMSEEKLRGHGITDQTKIDDIVAHGRRLRDPRLFEAVNKMPMFYQSISGLSVEDVIPHMRRWILTHVKPDRETRVPQCLIVYDYIKLALTSEVRSGVLAEWQQHGLHVAHLHDFATQYNIPIIAFGQTNNEMDDGIKCVAGGKRISENVDSVTYFKRKSEQERTSDGQGTHMCKIFKSRFGRGLWNSYINFDVDLRFGEFTELDVGQVRPPPPQDGDGDDDDHD